MIRNSFFNLSLSRLNNDINNLKTFINCNIFCLLSLFFFLLNLAVNKINTDNVKSFYLFFAIVWFSSTRQIYDCIISKDLKSRRLKILINLYILFNATVEIVLFSATVKIKADNNNDD